MSYTREQIEAALWEWNAAAVKLPLSANEGDRHEIDGIRFVCRKLISGRDGKEHWDWELMSSNWRPTGIVWPIDISIYGGWPPVAKPVEPAPLTATAAGNVCPKCLSSSQVWVNQLTLKLTCHRVGCHNQGGLEV